MKNSLITINWRHKTQERGLTETSLELLRKLEIKATKNSSVFTDLIKSIEKEYSVLQAQKIFDSKQEIEMLSKYIRIRT